MARVVLQGIPRADVKHQSNVLLSQVQLTTAASVRTGRYSGGMRRRLSVAIALLGACTAAGRSRGGHAHMPSDRFTF